VTHWKLLAILALAILAGLPIATYVVTTSRRMVKTEYQFEIRSPILIGEDSDFTRVGAGSGCECVRTGSGTESDPYLISRWTINASATDGIIVFGTSSHFIVRDVEIRGNGLSEGIHLDRVDNGKIVDCLIVGNSIGVYSFRSRNLQFINNTIEENTYGIKLEVSDGSRVLSNRFNQIKQVAIFVRGPNNSVTENVVRGAFGGINIDGTAGGANDNMVVQNSISDTMVYGIGVWRAARTVVRNNMITQNKGVGIVLTERSSNNSVEANVVTENRGGGILISEGSSQNTIKDNTAKGNGDGVRSFDLADTSSGNTWKNNTYDTKTPDTLE